MTEDVRRTYYLPGEGRAHMQACLSYAFARCAELGLTKLVVFTGTGEGALFALQELMPRPEYATIELVAVTPPVGRPYRLIPHDKSSPIVPAGLPTDLRDFLAGSGVAVVSGHLPFKPIGGVDSPSASMTMMGEVLSILGGGFPLCVQAALMACDAGAIGVGERVIVASGDTAIRVVTTRTETFLSRSIGFVVEEFICRPSVMNISKSENALVRALEERHDAAKIATVNVPQLAEKIRE
jgi:hypothetical protein